MRWLDHMHDASYYPRYQVSKCTIIVLFIMYAVMLYEFEVICDFWNTLQCASAS